MLEHGTNSAVSCGEYSNGYPPPACQQLDSGVSVLQRRITELEQALDRCQKRLEIPTVALAAHPEVEAASSKMGKGMKVHLDALGLGRRVQDDAFLNQVQVTCSQAFVAPFAVTGVVY